MAMTQFFRVAVEGPTVDGRNIERAQIQQMADSYAPATYTARINCEHLRGYSPQPPFNAYGSVAALKAEEIELSIGGKTQKRLALYAAFEVNDQAKALTEADQKVFSSVEINPNFAETGKAYLVGLALTDSPASLGTEILKFSRDAGRKDHLFALEEFTLAFAEESPDEAAAGAFAAMKRFFEGFAAPKTDAAHSAPLSAASAAPAQTIAPGTPPVQTGSGPAPTAAQLGDAFAAQMMGGLEALTKAFAAAQAKTDARLGKIAEDFATLRADVDRTPPRGYTARPLGGGAGAERPRARC